MATGAMAHAGTSATAYQRDLELAPQRSAGNTTETLEALICGPGNFRIEDMEPAEIQKQLFSKYKIYTISINWENINGILVTPNVYTSLREMDCFVEAVRDISG